MTRPFALLLLASLFGSIAGLLDATGSQAAEPSKLRVYIGTYSGGGSKGIYLSELDLATGKLTPPELAAEASNPSFVAIHPSGKFLYSVSEISTLEGKPTGGISAFSIEPKTGKLTLLNQQPSGGAGPCHVTVDRSGRCVLAANYGGGSVCVHPIGENGKLGEMSGFSQHKGSSVNASRQKEPHAHSINVDAENRFAFAADLGIDKVMIYRLDPATGKITPNDPPSVATPAGGGPRHFAFHPSGKFAFVNNEMTSSVTAYAYDAAAGSLKELQTLSTLPEPTPGNSTAETQVHPSGKYLYVSNRGHNSIAMFTIAEDGKMTAIGHQGAGINIPRNFSVDPTGKFALVANQNGNSVIVFRIDPATGKLEPTDVKIEVVKPVCVKMMAMP